jgi:hypothetical protein
MLADAYIEHSRDPLPACDDAAWTLAGLDRDAGRRVHMGTFSPSRGLMGPDGRLQLIFLGGDKSDGCTDYRSTTVSVVAAKVSDGSLADVEHSGTLTWIGASSPLCHTDFEFEIRSTSSSWLDRSSTSSSWLAEDSVEIARDPLSAPPSFYYRNASTQLCTRLHFATPFGSAIYDAYIEHSRDPLPACDDAAWTLADADRLVHMGWFSHSTMGLDGRLQLSFLGGDKSDGCTDYRTTTVTMVVAKVSDASLTDYIEHSGTLTWIGSSSPLCQGEFELEVRSTSKIAKLLQAEHIDEPPLFSSSWPSASSRGLVQAIRQVAASRGWLLPAENSNESAAAHGVPTPPPPPSNRTSPSPFNCPIVAAIKALLLPATVVTGIFLLAAMVGWVAVTAAFAWRRRSSSKAAPVLDWRLV